MVKSCLMNEDELFKKLKRIPFSQVICSLKSRHFTYEESYNLIIRNIHDMCDSWTEPNNWATISGGWTFSEFVEECKDRYLRLDNNER